MPSYVFAGLVETVYPFDRDAAGQPLGAVKPGDARDLGGPPDWRWVPAGPGTPPAPVSDPVPAGQAAPGQPGPAAAAPSPVPAPPAVVPPAGPAFAVTADQGA